MSAPVYYDPDEDARPPTSPMLKAIHPRRELSPSPNLPLATAPARRSDAVLLHYLDEGKHPDIPARATQGLVGSDGDDDGSSSSSASSHGDEDDELDKFAMSPLNSPSHMPAHVPKPGPIDLQNVAKLAYAAVNAPAASPKEAPGGHGGHGDSEMGEGSVSSTVASPSPPAPSLPPQPLQPKLRDAGFQRPVLGAPIMPYISPNTHLFSPRQSLPSQALRLPNDLQSPVGSPPDGPGELAPISPKSSVNDHGPLPSIRSTLGPELSHPELTHLQYPHSPPGGPRPIMTVPNHASPPISPNNAFQLSPVQSLNSIRSPPNYYAIGPGIGIGPLQLPRAYSSSSTETPGASTDAMSSPTTSTSISDRMSIDNMTHQPTGQFVCTFPGCIAQPFATQYLLNSHTNVHSSARPHYCAVKGCPRAEGGKGFKRKNEMIRHGLVHDSPGYVCPFCPDREHKYPRPDNLQRHVRVHHTDKDKDDRLLRDVLAQRPDGPNRGRRRRGAP